MHGEGFTEFVPPKIVSAGAEGGADMFEVELYSVKSIAQSEPTDV